MADELLDSDLFDVGWDNFGGRSFNIWLRTPVDGFLPESYLKGKNNIIKTAYDDEVLAGDKIPSKISATFKFCKDKYDAFCENFGYKLAELFGVQTTCNKIVKYDKKQMPKVEEYISLYKKKQDICDVGVLVADFLKKGESLNDFSFIADTTNNFNIGTWISALDLYMDNNPEIKNSNKSKQELKGEIIKQYLFRECFKDVDYSSNNAGLIYNNKSKTLRIAPSFDYGEMFNSLRQNKYAKPNVISNSLNDLKVLNYGIGLMYSKSQFNPLKEGQKAFPIGDKIVVMQDGKTIKEYHVDDLKDMVNLYINDLEGSKKQQEKSLSLKEIVDNDFKDTENNTYLNQMKENIEFAFATEPKICDEFCKTLKFIIKNNKCSTLLENYTKKQEDYEQILTDKDSLVINEYITLRMQGFENFLSNTKENLDRSSDNQKC